MTIIIVKLHANMVVAVYRTLTNIHGVGAMGIIYTMLLGLIHLSLLLRSLEATEQSSHA